MFTSLANRLLRLEKQLSAGEQQSFRVKTGGKTMQALARKLLNAYDPDRVEDRARELIETRPEFDRSPLFEKECRDQAQTELATQAAIPFTGKLNEHIEAVRKSHEQIIDIVNLDKIQRADWDSSTSENAQAIVSEFADYIAANRDEITALSFFYDQPYRRRELTFGMIKQLLEKLKADKPLLAPHYVWEAYARLEEVNGDSPKNELVALVSLVRRVVGIDHHLTAFNKTVDRNFREWVFKKHSGAGEKFNEEQMAWLRLLKDHLATSFHLEPDDLDYYPFDTQGGRGRMHQLFGAAMEDILTELNEVLVA